MLQAQAAMNGDGPYSGIVILDFGKPDFSHYDPVDPGKDEWGTRLTSTSGKPPFWYVTSLEIESVALEFAQGYYDIAKSAPSSHPPHVIVALGTNNVVDTSVQPVITSDAFRRHGQHWGTLVNELNDAYYFMREIVTFEAANDIEVAFGDHDHALRWAQGYEEVTRGGSGVAQHYYFAYGDCTNCFDGDDGDPSATLPLYCEQGPVGSNCWTVDQLVGAVSANRAARPLPEIYYDENTAGYANQPAQWQWLSKYAATHYICLTEYGIAPGIPGTMMIEGPMADGMRPTPTVVAPSAAWQQLWKSLKAGGITYPPSTPIPGNFMQFVTKIKYYP